MENQATVVLVKVDTNPIDLQDSMAETVVEIVADTVVVEVVEVDMVTDKEEDMEEAEI